MLLDGPSQNLNEAARGAAPFTSAKRRTLVPAPDPFRSFPILLEETCDFPSLKSMFDQDLALVVRVRCRVNMAHIRQKGPDSGLGFQVKMLKTF